MSALNAFTTQLVNFFEELCTTFPEERDIKLATEAITGAKKINPRLILDLFTEHVYTELAESIAKRDIEIAKKMLSKNHSISDISDLTGLSPEEISKL